MNESRQPGLHLAMGAPIEALSQHLMGFQGAHRLGLLNSVYSAGAHGSARQSWIELARPLSTINLNAGGVNAIGGGGTAAGGLLVLPTVQLPIGMDIKNILAAVCDIDYLQWGLVQFVFGTLTLVNPVSTAQASSLAPFDPRLPHVDRVAPWIGAKTKVDVQCTATVQNNWVGGFTAVPTVAGSANIFHGFSIQAYQEEQVCAIQTRIEPTGRNVGNYDIISHLMHGYASIAGTMPAYPQNQPAAATGSVMSHPQFFAPQGIPSSYAQVQPAYNPQR